MGDDMKRFSYMYFRRILYANISIICIVVICASFISIMLSDRAAIHAKYEDLLDNSNRKLQIEETLLSGMLSTANSIFRNQNVSPFIKFNHINDDLKSIVLQTLQQYANDIARLGSIYAYAEYSDYVALVRSQNVIELVKKEEFSDAELKRIFRDRENLRNDVVYPRMIHPYYGGGESDNYTFIGFDGVRMKDGPGYCIVINMPQSWLTDYLYESAYDHSRMLIVDSNGRAITSSGYTEFGANAAAIDFVKTVLSANKAGYYVTDVNQVKTLIVYSNENRLGHRIITLKPVAEILRPQLPIRLTILLFSLVLLVMGAITGYAFLRHAYRPIDTALTDAVKSDLRGMRAQEILRSRFIYSLITDHRFAQHVKNNDFDRLGIPLRVENPLYICYIQIDNVNHFESTYPAETKQAFFFAIRNVAAEIMSEKFIITSCDIKSMSCAVMLMNTLPEYDPDSDFPKEITLLLQRAITAIRDSIDLSISATFLFPACRFQSVTEAFSCVETASRQRYLNGYGSIFIASFDQFRTLPKSTAGLLNIQDFTSEFEPLLISGQAKKCKAIIKKLITDISDASIDDVQLFHAIVNYSFRRAINSLHKASTAISQVRIRERLDSFRNYETRDLVLDFYNEIIDSVCEVAAQAKKSHLSDIVTKINEIIDAEYADPNLSIEKIADVLQYTPSYIGKIYKTYTNTNILAQITERRISAAMALLHETNNNIDAIANQCGYLNTTYFFRIFKQQTGLTPSDYRRSLS